MSDLPRAIEALFVTFAPYRADGLDGCPHCVEHTDSVCLRTTPLRALKAADLSRYAFKAMTTWGTPGDYKHFLPRIVELCAFDPAARGYPGLDIALVFQKIASAGFASWDAREREAVASLMHAWWARLLAHRSDPSDLGAFVDGVGLLERSPMWLVETWQRDRSREATVNLARYATRYGAWNPHMPRGGFRDAPGLVARAFDAWLTSDDAFDRLSEEYFAAMDAPDGKRLAEAIDGLRPPR